MKKFLSIILTVLMLVTMIPFAPLTMAADTVTVYLKNDAGWRSTMYAYCWKENDSVRPLGNWPGTLMDEVEGESQLYAIDVPTDIYAIIFSDGGINQTPDLFLPADGSNYYNNATGEWTTISTRGHDHALTAGGEALEFATFPAGATEISTAGNYYLTQDIELTDNLWINVEGTVNLCLNGHSITAVEKGGNPVVVILKAGTLNLCDCQGGGCITSAEDLELSGVRTLADTEFNMYSGEIKNNYYYAVECIDFNMYGGKLSGNKQAAVDVKGAFNMYGGEISGNSGEWGTVSVGNNGSFTMYDGEIKDNINKSTYWNSGTVYVQNGIFTMKGGKITGNTGGSGTGGVHAYRNFVMDGGEISGNSGNSGGVSVGIDGVFTMNGGKISGNKSNLGGGVYINERASFNMNGGEISGNTAEQGGGVFSTYDSAKINLKKGVITGNSATYAGGVGAQYANTPVEISGADVQIVNNTAPNYPDLRANAPVIVSAPLDSAKTKISLSVNGEIIAKPDGTNLTTLEGMEDCFIVSEEDGFIKCNEKGELELTEWNASISEKDGDFVVEAPHNGAYTITYQWYELNGDELTELEGETSDKLTADKIVIGKTYACKIYLDGEEKEMLTIGCSYAITHQPTVAEPYVELNDDTDASYQWYTVEDGITEVTDENADTVAYDWGESSYNKETGWTGVSCEEGGTEYDFFTVELEAGETITVEVTGDFIDGLGLWDYDTENYAWVDSEEYVTSYELTVESEGNYTFYTYVNSGVVTVKAFKTAFDKIAIEGEISAELKNPEFGKKYACEVTFADDTTEMSNAFEYKYAITHQPTEAEPYVELNDDTDATYRWYAVEGDKVEFTNENANPIDYYDGPTEYDPETGWNADFWSETGGYFFYVYLEEGEKITVEFNHPVYDEVGIWGYYEDDGDYSYLNGETTVSLVAPFNDYFDIYAYGINADTRVKAYIDNRIYTEIEGQIAAELTPTALGKYACEVTFVDGTTEMSEAFEVTTLHTCDFTGEWKYDSEKHWKECTADNCDKISEESEHSFTDGKCACGYACPHDSYTNGFCPNCDAFEPAELVDGVYEISNAGNLYWFADKVTNENAAYGSADAILTCDIRVNEGTMTEASTDARVWTPIGKLAFGVRCPYTGTFEGNGKTVSGLYFNDTSANFAVGLFSLVGEGGKVQNVGIADSYFCGGNNVGAVVGNNFGTVTGCYNTGIVSGSSYVSGVVSANDGTVTNCYNTGTVSGTSSVGGVVGDSDGIVTDCHNTGAVSGSSYVGGVVGYNSGTATNCTNSGTVSGSDEVGGVAGKNEDTVTGCYNTGTVNGTTYVGGVVGYNWTTVTNCYNSGTVSGSDEVGGVAGHNWTTVTNCYNTGTVSGTTDVGGVVGYNISDTVTVTNCYFDSTVYTGDAIGNNYGTATDVEGKSTEQFASGEVAYLLSQDENGSIWGQDLDNGKPVQTTPTFNGAKVYCGYTSCGDTVAKYTNDETISAEKPDHTQKPTYTDNGNGTHSATYSCCGTTVTEDHTGGTATCTEQAKCEHCGASYGEFDWTNHEGEYVTVWYNDYKHVSEYECCHIESSVVYEDHKYENYTITTPADCVNNAWETGKCICGDTHTREIADSATDHNWSNKDGICANGCGEVCPHEKYTNGICDNCDYECPHEWGEGVLTRPVYDAVLGSKDGYYTYTCIVCAKEKKETVKSADYSAYDAVSEEINGLLQSDDLTPEAKQAIYSAANECGLLSNDLMESEQNIVDDLVAELKKIVADAEEKIANGEYVKADYTAIDEAIAEIEEKLADENVTDEGKAGLEEIKKQLEEMKADENTSAADVAELEKALEDYEEELDKGIEDGTLVMVDGFAIAAEATEKWEERLESEGLTDEYEDFINNQKATDEALAAEKEINDFANSLEGTVAENAENIAKLNEMIDSIFALFENCLRGTHNFGDYEVTSSAKCEVNAIETRTCWFCGETDEREVEGSALEHSFTKYEVTEEAKCGVAGKKTAYCDHGCGATDEKEIEALTHVFDRFVSNGDATCTADGTKTATCIHGCGTEETVTDEGTKLDHADEDGDSICDDCEAEIIDVCPDCGRPVHEDEGIPNYICIIIMFIRLVVSLVKALQGIA